MLSELNEEITSLNTDLDVQAIILVSSNPGMFCSGADLKERLNLNNKETEATVKNLRDTFQRVFNLPVPTIACLDGMVLGGGLELALACDMRVTTSTSKLGLPETALAIIPGAGGTARLPRLVGPGLAKEIIFTGRILDAEEAQKFGVVNHVENGFEESWEKSKKLAVMIGKKGPKAVRQAKLALNGTLDVGIEEGLELERQCYGRIVATEDRLEGLASFMEKRKPVYKGK